MSYLNIAAAAIAFVLTAVLGKFFIPFLRKLKYGQTILEVGPKWHKDKQGTPTMGGIIFIVGIVVAVMGCTLFYGFNVFGTNLAPSEATFPLYKVWSGLLLALGFGIIGFIDDYIKVVKKRNLGLTSKQKLILQFAIAIAYIALMNFFGDDTSTIIPFLGEIELGWWYWVISVVLIVGFDNAVNFSDGLDGLCSAVTFFAAISFMVMASFAQNQIVSMLCIAVAGGCAGFLVWNFYPAKVFMGDTGSLFLGGIVAALAFALDVPILLVPVGIIYFCEIGSVVLQVLYFKLTKGKRLFKMSPIHHHFEMCGWTETKIVFVFSFVTIIFGAAACALYYFGYII